MNVPQQTQAAQDAPQVEEKEFNHDQNFIQAGRSLFQMSKTRIHKGRTAPAGSMFIVIRIVQKTKKYKTEYVNYRQIPFGMTDEQQLMIGDILFQQLNAKYKFI